MDERLLFSKEDFGNLMDRIDQRLSAQGVPIRNRPIRALGLISSEYSVPLPITEPPTGASDAIGRNWPFCLRVYGWYHLRYGDRLKSHFGPGRVVVLIRNDPWVLSLPRCLGTVKPTASRTAVSEKVRTDGNPAVYNILDGVQNITAGLKESLRDQDLAVIFDLFQIAYKAFTRLESLISNPLIESALSDFDAAVEHIMVRDPNFGLSKWASLQAAEKLFKAAISIRGGSYSKIHELKELAEEASRHGIATPPETLLSKVQCSPGIRYGEEVTGLLEAVEAHHASIEICLLVSEQLGEASGRPGHTRKN